MKIHRLIALLLALTLGLLCGLPALGEENRIWRLGDSGEKVSEIQARLRELNYLDREPTGIFDEETEQALRECALSQDKVLGVDAIQTREFGSRIYVDIEIRADGSLSLSESHAVAEAVHDRIEEQFPKVKHIMVHVNPEE